MSEFSAIAAYGAGQLLLNENESATVEAQRKARQSTAQNAPTGTAAQNGNPVDTIVTSPAASAALSAFLKQSNAESQKEFDAEQLKEALTQLHLLQLLGTSLPADKLAKETTDLAKRIAGIAQDYASNSSPGPSAATSATDPATSATNAANNAAKNAGTAAATQSAVGSGTAQATAAGTAAITASPTAPSAAQAAAGTVKPSVATPAGQLAGTTGPAASDNAQSTPAAGASTTAGAAGTSTTAAAGSDQGADSAAGFFAQVAAAFKDLKKIESKALAQLSLDKDPKKRDLAKKYGGEFNDAVLSTEQSAAAAGVPEPELAQDTIDVAKVTFNISA
jgi:hypothetical protein